MLIVYYVYCIKDNEIFQILIDINHIDISYQYYKEKKKHANNIF